MAVRAGECWAHGRRHMHLPTGHRDRSGSCDRCVQPRAAQPAPNMEPCTLLLQDQARVHPCTRRVKVYVGETNNAARRHNWEYRAHGDHLAPFFEAALNDGCTVWRRVRYTVRPNLPRKLQPASCHCARSHRCPRRHACAPAPCVAQENTQQMRSVASPAILVAIDAPRRRTCGRLCRRASRRRWTGSTGS